MASPMSARSLRTYTQFQATLFAVLSMWLLYVLLSALYLPEPWASVLGFIPGCVGVGALLLTGFDPKYCYLPPASISKAGAVMLMASFLPMIPVVLTGLHKSGWASWDWITAFVYAPASGVAQELYFRSALLPTFEWALGRRSLALIISSLLFSLFHVGMFKVAPVGAAFSALGVTFVVGLGWGWQVQRDRTVLWAMIHHSLLQIILRMFAWTAT